jgi:cytochrome P450
VIESADAASPAASEGVGPLGPDRVPVPGLASGRRALRAWMKEGIIGALRALRDTLGPVFSLPLPGFHPIVVSGPEAVRYVLVTARRRLEWRMARDPVARLLRHGVLVEDGEAHDRLRRALSPPLRRGAVRSHVAAMWRSAERVAASWPDGGRVDMLVEMRKVTLLILAETLFGFDLAPDLDRLWPHILRLLSFIAPGRWMVWSGAPRLGYGRSRRAVDDYLYGLIRQRRLAPDGDGMLSRLVRDPSMTDDLIRDQLLTMLIAGHDTTTALLAWTLVLLVQHPETLQRAAGEVDTFLTTEPPDPEQIDQLDFLESVVHESLRLYPPIHLGNRRVADGAESAPTALKPGRRLLYSIYLTHRDPRHWPDPDRFDPDRFRRSPAPAPYAFVPFGGGPRNCIGAHFGLVEAKVVLAYLLRHWRLSPLDRPVRAHMGATLEPRPGVRMTIARRRTS